MTKKTMKKAAWKSKRCNVEEFDENPKNCSQNNCKCRICSGCKECPYGDHILLCGGSNSFLVSLIFLVFNLFCVPSSLLLLLNLPCCGRQHIWLVYRQSRLPKRPVVFKNWKQTVQKSDSWNSFQPIEYSSVWWCHLYHLKYRISNCVIVHSKSISWCTSKSYPLSKYSGDFFLSVTLDENKEVLDFIWRDAESTEFAEALLLQYNDEIIAWKAPGEFRGHREWFPSCLQGLSRCPLCPVQI